jgi:hypothetical protein
MLFGHNWLVGLSFVIKFFSQKIIAQESGKISKITLHVLKQQGRKGWNPKNLLRGNIKNNKSEKW